MSDGLMTLESVAVRAGCSARTVERAVRAGRGPQSVKVGKFLRFEPGAVELWLGSCRR
jgi:predicted DNA-binding transcriptional regulator AlpA